MGRNENDSVVQESAGAVFKVPGTLKLSSRCFLTKPEKMPDGKRTFKKKDTVTSSNKMEEEFSGFQEQYMTFLNRRKVCDAADNSSCRWVGESTFPAPCWKHLDSEAQIWNLLHSNARWLFGEQVEHSAGVVEQVKKANDEEHVLVAGGEQAENTNDEQNTDVEEQDTDKEQDTDGEEQSTKERKQAKQSVCHGDHQIEQEDDNEGGEEDTCKGNGFGPCFCKRKAVHLSGKVLHNWFYPGHSRTVGLKNVSGTNTLQSKRLDSDCCLSKMLPGNNRHGETPSNKQARDPGETNTQGVSNDFSNSRQSRGNQVERAQKSWEYVSMARTLIVPLPSPPPSSWNQKLCEKREAFQRGGHDLPLYMQYWQPSERGLSDINYLGSHCIYGAYRPGFQQEQEVQACICGDCCLYARQHASSSVYANTKLVPSVTDSMQNRHETLAPWPVVMPSAQGHCLYPLPPSIMSVPCIVQKSPAGTFKPVKVDHSKDKKEARAASVRKTLEGASTKLRHQKFLLEQKEKKSNLLKLSSRKESIIKRIMSKKRVEKKDEKKEREPQPQKISKSKRRTSLRLKTLAKVLGKKRPNYSLVLSGYADMEEYEEEQKKKAARFALARARAEARARASAKTLKVKETDKMVTRSSSVTTLRTTGDSRRPSLDKKPGVTVVRKGQNTLANIIESKRVKKENGKDVEVQDDGGIKQMVEKEAGKKTASSSPPHPKKASTKKGGPEKVTPSVVPAPDPSLTGLDEVPTFWPTEEEFSDPISYITSIRDQAELFGMCKIIPPASWKMESKVNEEIRFTTQIQHLHRLFSRWGPSVEHTTTINHHLRGVVNNHNIIPQIGGVEVDLSQLYRMIRDFGGLQNIVDKKQWVKVADAMKIPKTAHDRVTRLYDIYCKHVLPYAMLTDTEKAEVQKEVFANYETSSAEEEAILKGKSMTLSAFSRVARNVQSMWFKEDPSPEVVEAAYWKIVKERDTHVAVQCAHVNTRAQSTAFPTRRESPYFRHSWNLNNLPENKKCILKCLGPVSGATIPTLHVGMLFSTSCWSTDPHRLPYVQYLHTGANTIWYSVPKTQVQAFHEAMKELCPTLLHNDPCWLKEDTAMVKPDELMSRGVRIARCIQQPRQFVVVFPDVFTATVCCGYSVSESVHYATLEWLSLCIEAAKALSASKEKELFSVDTLVCGLCQDSNDPETLASALPLLESIVSREIDERHQLSAAGLKCERRLAVEDSPGNSSSLARKRSHDLTEDSVCEVCSKICYLSMVLNEHDEQILCLKHGLKYVQRKRHIKAAKLFYRYTEEELTELVQTTKDRLVTLTSSCGSSNLPKKRLLKKQDSKS